MFKVSDESGRLKRVGWYGCGVVDRKQQVGFSQKVVQMYACAVVIHVLRLAFRPAIPLVRPGPGWSVHRRYPGKEQRPIQ